MPSLTNEQALEAAIQEKLSGLTLEEIKEKVPAANAAEESEQYRAGNDYFIGNFGDFNARSAVDTRKFWSFFRRLKMRNWKNCSGTETGN